jgi:hypothetical protein
MRITSILRMLPLPQTRCGLPPNPFHELADRLADEHRLIVTMLLLRADRDEIARACGISARSLMVRCEAIGRCLDAAGDRLPTLVGGGLAAILPPLP